MLQRTWEFRYHFEILILFLNTSRSRIDRSYASSIFLYLLPLSLFFVYGFFLLNKSHVPLCHFVDDKQIYFKNSFLFSEENYIMRYDFSQIVILFISCSRLLHRALLILLFSFLPPSHAFPSQNPSHPTLSAPPRLWMITTLLGSALEPT